MMRMITAAIEIETKKKEENKLWKGRRWGKLRGWYDCTGNWEKTCENKKRKK